MILDVRHLPKYATRPGKSVFNEQCIQVLRDSLPVASGGSFEIAPTDKKFTFAVKGLSMGQGTIEVQVAEPFLGRNFDRAIVTVVDVGMDMEDVREDEELSPGGFIPVGQLKPLIIRCPQPGTVSSTVQLSVQEEGAGRARLWADAANEALLVSTDQGRILRLQTTEN
jgi:hypothetical protein